jgi:hypothetical protein
MLFANGWMADEPECTNLKEYKYDPRGFRPDQSYLPRQKIKKSKNQPQSWEKG